MTVTHLLSLARPLPTATHLLSHAEYGYTANTPLADATVDNAMVAYQFDGEPLEGQHGYPARLIIPHLYFWKSTKWLRGLELRVPAVERRVRAQTPLCARGTRSATRCAGSKPASAG